MYLPYWRVEDTKNQFIFAQNRKHYRLSNEYNPLLHSTTDKRSNSQAGYNSQTNLTLLQHESECQPFDILLRPL